MVKNPLRQRIDMVVDTWRLVAIAVGVLFATLFFTIGGLMAAALSAIITFISYRIGLMVIASWFTRIITDDEIKEAIRADALNEIMARQANGTLEPHDPETLELLTQAGLRPAPEIIEYGPVFGRYGEVELYDWVKAKDEHDIVFVYNYAGIANVTADGLLILPDETKNYLCTDGILYELVSTSADEPVASDSAD